MKISVRKSATFVALLFCTVVSSAQQGILSQKIVFQQPYTFKNNAFSKKLMSGHIFEDSATNERLVVLSGNKVLNFYLVNIDWKLLKTFEVATPKNSTFNNDNFEVGSFTHKDDRWTLITGSNTDFNAEVVDTKDQTFVVAGAVFQDKDKKYFSKTLYDGKRFFSVYPNRSGSITVGGIDETGTVKNFPLDLSTQLPLKKSKKFTPKDIWEMFEDIDTITSQIIYLTRKKVHFYKNTAAYIFTVSDTEPVTEVNYFDKNTWKKIRSDIFSVEELIPATEKNNTLNTSSLIFDNKVWVLTAYKDGAVLGVFDIESKKLVYSLKLDGNTPESTFAYGPIMYKSAPAAGKIFSGTYEVKEKAEPISVKEYIKELGKRDIALYLHHFNENEYAVSISSYSMMSFQTPGAPIRDMQGSMSDPSVYESAVAGLVFKKNDVNPVGRKTSFNEVNFSNATAKYTVQKIEKKGPMQQPEFSGNRKAYVMKEQVIKNRVYTLYYLDEMFKIFEKVTAFDLSAFGLK